MQSSVLRFRSARSIGIGAMIVLGSLAAALPAPASSAEPTRIISLNPQGNPVGFGGQLQGISGDGRFVVLQSRALIPGDTSGQVQVYVYDLETDQPELISVQPDGTASNTSVVGYDSPHSRVISSDGRYVLFRTRATDILPGVNTNGVSQLYRRDRMTGTTEIVSVDNARVEAANADIVEYTMDCTGQGIVFRTGAFNLDPLGQGGTFLHQADAAPGSTIVTRRACVDIFGDPIGCRNFSYGNGLLAFSSSSSDVSPNDPPGTDLFVGNVIDGNNILLTEDVGTVAISRFHSPPASACSGHRVAFRTNVNLFFNPDANFVPQLYVVDTVSGQRIRIGDPDSAGDPVVDGSSNGRVSISDNGWLIGFQSVRGMDPRDTNGVRDAYFIELNSSFSAYQFLYAGHWNDNPANGNGSLMPRIANSGTVAFTSAATNSPPWPNTNGFNHVFVNVLDEELQVLFRSGFE